MLVCGVLLVIVLFRWFRFFVGLFALVVCDLFVYLVVRLFLLVFTFT